MITKADIKLIRSLSDKSGRTQSGLFVVEGEKMVGELLSSGWKVERMYRTERCGLPMGAGEQIGGNDMERISLMKCPTTCLAVAHIPEREFDQTIFEHELVLALDDVQDPGNMGTIIRLADWFGIGSIICSAATADCFNPKVVQATMGALFRVRVVYGDLRAMLDCAVRRNVEIYGTLLSGENIYDCNLDCNAVVVMGNEGQGISEQVEEKISRRLFIPPYPTSRHGTESLNVAVATAVVCSEFRRRQQ